jgi:hypothetical protein
MINTAMLLFRMIASHHSIAADYGGRVPKDVMAITKGRILEG